MIKTIFFLFEKNEQKTKTQLFLALFFTLFTIVALSLDSIIFTKCYFDARQITNLLAIIYFSLLFWFSNSYLRKLMIVMVFLSYLGELIFCKLLGLYSYRTSAIPLYVPFGHAIVYASGYIFAQTSWAVKNDNNLKILFVLFFVFLFLGVAFMLNDLFSLLFGTLFFVLLRRKYWNNLYFFIALCVIFIELVGTFFGCWRWIPKIFNTIPTANPPMGAVFFYAGGDMILAKIVASWESKN